MREGQREKSGGRGRAGGEGGRRGKRTIRRFWGSEGEEWRRKGKERGGWKKGQKNNT